MVTLLPLGALRQDLAAAGVIPALVGSLGFADSAVQASVAEAIGLLACDAAVRQEFSACGGVPSLLPLLCSSSEEVRGCAVWTLAVCAQSREVAEQACQNGYVGLHLHLHSTCHPLHSLPQGPGGLGPDLQALWYRPVWGCELSPVSPAGLQPCHQVLGDGET